MKELAFRLGNDEDKTAILRLMETVFESDRLTSKEFFDWQYRQNPAGPATIGCGEASDGQLVACLPTIPVPIRIRGRQGRAGHILNVATHPDYRRRGLFVGCAKAAFDELARKRYLCMFGFPNEMIYWGYIRKFAFRDLGQPVTLRHFFNLDTIASRLGNWARWLPMRTLGGLFLRFAQKSPKRAAEVQEIGSFDRLPMERFSSTAGFAIAADAAWLNWRYIRHPFLKYKIAVAGDIDAPLGVAVYQIHQSGPWKRGILMELFLPEDNYTLGAEALTAHLFEKFQAAGCTDAFFLASPGSRKAHVLRSCGYWATPKRFGSSPKMIFKALADNVDDVTLADVDCATGMLDTA